MNLKTDTQKEKQIHGMSWKKIPGQTTVTNGDAKTYA